MRLPATLLFVTLTAACADGSAPSDPGTIEVTTTTTGSTLDPDGYTVSLAGGAEQPIDPNGSTEFTGLAGGDYEITLGGVADNCAVRGANPRAAVLAAGATAKIAFTVACVAPSGSIEVTTQTAGVEPDPDGYGISIDGNPSTTPVPVSGSVTISPIPVGSHALRLEGVAANCLAAGPSPVTVTVSLDGPAEVQFQVNCPSPGTLRVTASTAGGAPDQDGYQVQVDLGTPQAIEPNGSLSLELGAWTHTVKLLDVAANCVINGPSSQTVDLASGAATDLAFEVLCSAPGTGQILVRTHSGGTFSDPDGYRVSLDGGPAQPIGINAFVYFTEVAPGVHSVRLTGLTAGCGFFLQNPKQVVVNAETTTPVDFNVLCIP